MISLRPAPPVADAVHAAFRPVSAMAPDVIARVRRRAIFDCCKWDPQVEDVCTIADVPLVLSIAAWRTIVGQAESLAREVHAAEEELRGRPELHDRLGLPRAIVRALRRGSAPDHVRTVRFIRFDFHLTENGWRISEANTDVPGGLNEASGLPAIVGPLYPGTRPVGDVADAYARAVVDTGMPGALVALVHATAYCDDRQVMAYLARRLELGGARALLASPAHLRWSDGRATLDTPQAAGPVDAVVRFFPAEWLPNLPWRAGWRSYFERATTPVSNPGSAILTQTKRFPLVWDRLWTPLPTWKALLPETHDARDVRWQGSDEWVLKPALGRVGEDIGIAGVTAPREWEKIARAVRRHPAYWVVQRRFAATAVRLGEHHRYPSVGVYTVNGRVAGAYGRIAERPLIDARARDAAVLVAES